jgi:hypothetical protein
MPVLLPSAPSAVRIPKPINSGWLWFPSPLFAVSKQSPPVQLLLQRRYTASLLGIPMTKHTRKDRGTAALLGSTWLGRRMAPLRSFTLVFHRNEKERAGWRSIRIRSGLPRVSRLLLPPPPLTQPLHFDLHLPLVLVLAVKCRAGPSFRWLKCPPSVVKSFSLHHWPGPVRGGMVLAPMAIERCHRRGGCGRDGDRSGWCGAR